MPVAATWPPRSCLRLGLATAAAVLGLSATADAKAFEVTRLGDPIPDACAPTDCSLREAVLAANERPGPDIVRLPADGPYGLARTSTAEDVGADGDLDLNDDVSIEHPGVGRATIDADRVDRHFEVAAGVAATLRHLRLIRGRANGADSFGGGGAAFVNGTLRIFESVIAGNRALGSGGGVMADDFPAGLGIAIVTRSTISGNVADGNSGALGLDGRRATVKASALTGNRSKDEGGASFVFVQQRADFVQSTIANNRAPISTGGIQAHEGLVRVVNSTVAGNRTDGVGGGLYASDSLNLNAVTVAGNTAAEGGGVYNGGITEIRNSLIGLNRLVGGKRNDCDDEDESIDSLGHNLISRTGPSGSCTGFARASDLVRRDPGIGPLAHNGGPTRTVALKAGSPAIGRADDLAPARDQRGAKRDGDPDIGAFERL